MNDKLEMFLGHACVEEIVVMCKNVATIISDDNTSDIDVTKYRNIFGTLIERIPKKDIPTILDIATFISNILYTGVEIQADKEVALELMFQSLLVNMTPCRGILDIL